MKVLFCALPAFGHVYPMMPLAEAARAAGHDVGFATCEPFVAKLRALGFAAFPVGMTIDAAVAEVITQAGGAMPKSHDGRPDLDSGGRLFLEVLAPRTADELLPVLQATPPDLVVYEQYDIGAGVAAGVMGIPAVVHAVSPQMPAAVVAAVAADRVERLWARYGTVAPFDAFTGLAYLDIVPLILQQSDFADHPARRPLRPVPWAEPTAALPAWVATVRGPLVYVTLGTIVATDAVLAPVVEGLASLDAEVLVALGSAAGQELGALPANVHVEPFVDQARLLPHADLVVHHAGTGTTLGALAHGKRQILLPKGADQFFVADLVARAELAPVLEPAAVTPEAVALAAKDALARPVPPAVNAVRDEIATLPAPADVFEALVTRFG